MAVEYGSFNDIQEVEYVKFDQGMVKVFFESSDFIVDKNAYGNQQYTFIVKTEDGIKNMAITSKRLMLRLKAFHPLKGKTFEIERFGHGMDVDYNVGEVDE